jgi:hypothetical protein
MSKMLARIRLEFLFWISNGLEWMKNDKIFEQVLNEYEGKFLGNLSIEGVGWLGSCGIVGLATCSS